MNVRKKRVIVALSGGVDSSFSAYLLRSKGYDVLGVTLLMHDGQKEIVKAASDVASFLGIKHIVIDVKDVFRQKVIDYFVNEYMRGKTPNPCVYCNPLVKFKVLFDLLREYEADFIATGHYVGVIKSYNGDCFFVKAVSGKDQSYMLYRLEPTWLKKLKFPLYFLDKSDVRHKALALGIPFLQKESQDVCFLPDGISAGDYIKSFLGPEAVKEGDFVDKKGKVIGRHKGLCYYTIGQRRHLGISSPRRYYVLGLDPKRNVVFLGDKEDLFTESCYITKTTWFKKPKMGRVYTCKHRYKAKEVPCVLEEVNEDSAKVRFIEPAWAVTYGQSLVIYAGDVLIGGGIITEKGIKCF